MNQPLHTKHRPGKLADIIGQGPIIASLEKVIERGGSQAFIFCGPSGTGKTTLSRICARLMGCLDKDIMEIPAAVFTGVDHMRQVQDSLQYKPFGKGKGRAIILDEAHMLSRGAWNSLLKAIEEPPPFVYWFICTTESSKIPDTIKTRCTSFTLKSIPEKELCKLFDRVCEKESIELADDIRDLIVAQSNGSPRQLLVNLELCRDVETKKGAAEILRTAIQSDSILELCRFVVAGKGSWTKATSILNKLEEENPESVRIIVCNYVAACLRKASSDQSATHLLRILENFATPYQSSERMAPLYLSVGRVLFAGD